MAIQSMHHVCIQTEKYQESMDFYTEILGFEVVQETAGFHGRDYNTWLKLGDFMIELQTPKKGDSLIPWNSKNSGIVHICFMVDSVKEEYDRIRSLGYNEFKVKNGQVIYHVEDGYLFKVKAPEGTEVEMRDSVIE